MNQENPLSQKKLGKKISGFDEKKWLEVCDDVMLEGVSHKFYQNKDLADYLVGTCDRIIIESSPYDLYWGSGCKLHDPLSLVSSKHKGLNRMGTILMKVRSSLGDTLMDAAASET